MAIEQTCTQMVPKPWGSTDLRPWSAHHGDSVAIGEIWFRRPEAKMPAAALRLKLLFTSEPLSIQVHPNDAFARSIGLAHGKCEAWYILSATPDAKVALGLKRQLSPAQLRMAIDEGSIAELIQWRSVRLDEVIYVPAGTIHTIGPGLVIMEIQQWSDATFRLFDYGRQRELHTDNAVAAASAEQTEHQAPLRHLTTARTLLVASPHFVLERVELAPGSAWELAAAGETWLFTLDGRARAGALDARIGEVIFLETVRTRIEVGSDGFKGLVAYAGSDSNPSLLRKLDDDPACVARGDRESTPLQPKTMPVSAAVRAHA
ncbi:MAG: class I mannose-6-phosphate isomerase [Steroidobacteraceae bacterium]